MYVHTSYIKKSIMNQGPQVLVIIPPGLCLASVLGNLLLSDTGVPGISPFPVCGPETQAGSFFSGVSTCHGGAVV